MAVSIQTLLKKTKEKYPIKLIAGERGLGNTTQWVSMVDNDKVVPYIRDMELVITTGFALNNDRELLDMCENLYKHRASGFIINEGFYIKDIPEDIIRFCNDNDFPLITFPWEVRVMDVIGEMDRIIFEHEKADDNVVELFKDIIFIENIPHEKYEMLERSGFGNDHYYTMVLIKSRSGDFEGMADKVLSELQRLLHTQETQAVSFRYEDRLIIMVKACKNDELHRFVASIQRVFSVVDIEEDGYVAVSARKEKLKRLRQVYQELESILPLGIKREQHVIYYEELDVYKLLLAVDGRSHLKQYHDDILKKLMDYDEINGTSLFVLLQQYINTSGSIQVIAELNYVHRNTINYQLKKVESILDCDLTCWDSRMKIQLAMLIHDML